MGHTHSSHLKPKNTGSKKIFDNPILERLTRTHIAVPISIFIFISLLLLYYAFICTTLIFWQIPLLFLSGFLFFTLLEYVVHRFLFHLKSDAPFAKNIQYHLHGVHHEYPKDKGRLAMPPLISIAIAAVFFALFYSLMHTKTFGFLPGMLTGYSLYLFVHFVVHVYQPPDNIFRHLWINHAIHHYKDNKFVFGVSSPLWDYIFGTMPKK